MNSKCLFGHKWNGCKCERCGKLQGTYAAIASAIEKLRFTMKDSDRKALIKKCVEMIGQLKEQEFLRNIAKNKYCEFDLRKAAIERISDQKILVEIAVPLLPTYNVDDDRLSSIARGKVINKQDIEEAYAARKAETDKLITLSKQLQANEKRLQEERISEGCCPNCGSKETPVYGLIKSLDMYGDYCPNCGEPIRIS